MMRRLLPPTTRGDRQHLFFISEASLYCLIDGLSDLCLDAIDIELVGHVCKWLGKC
jgi:hypothetical protein